VVERHFDEKAMLEFYGNVYDNPKFDRRALSRLLKQGEASAD